MNRTIEQQTAEFEIQKGDIKDEFDQLLAKLLLSLVYLISADLSKGHTTKGEKLDKEMCFLYS